MKTWKTIFSKPQIRWFDHTRMNTFQNEPFTALQSFALDDALTLSVSEAASVPILRLWAHEQTVVLGIPDARLPYIQEGIQFLHEQGYQAIVRNSGGLAVPLDMGVLNISFIVPKTTNLSIHEGYDAMFHFIQYIFRDLTDEIKAFEITGSYCPGDYDLSIHGKKFAGISQRRVRDGVTIQIYLDLFGHTFKKGELIRDFYRMSLQDEETPFHYPVIIPGSVKSLTELLGQAISVNEVKERIRKTLATSEKELVESTLTSREKEHYEARLQLMKKRNEGF